MNKVLFFIYFLLFNLSFAQATRFVYEYRYLPDSLDDKNRTTEIMFLDVTNDRSEFYSYSKFLSDSTLFSYVEKNQSYMPENKRFLNFRITKKKKTNEITLHTLLIHKKFNINLFENLDWKITNETEKIVGLTSQKASTVSNGKQWTAYFCTTYSINDGPYKFSGLPGLITKIEDQKKRHVFTLIGIIKLKNYDYQNRIFDFLNANEIKINRKEYSKIVHQYLKDPVAHLFGKIQDQTDTQGKFRTASDILNEIRHHEMKYLKENNNMLNIIDFY